MRDSHDKKTGRPPSEEICTESKAAELPEALKMLNIRRIIAAGIFGIASAILFLVMHTTQCFVLCLISGYFLLQNRLLKYDYRKGRIVCECVEADLVQKSGLTAQFFKCGKAKIVFNELQGDGHFKFVVPGTLANEIESGSWYRIYFRRSEPEILLAFEEI